MWDICNKFIEINFCVGCLLQRWTTMSLINKIKMLWYSRVHISSDTAFLKIVKKPSIVQE